MVVLVLSYPRGVAFELDRVGRPVGHEGIELDRRMSLDPSSDSREGEAPLDFLVYLFTHGRDNRIDSNERVAFLRVENPIDVEDEDPQALADLRGRQADAPGLDHRDEHPGGERLEPLHVHGREVDWLTRVVQDGRGEEKTLQT